ncbi:MAG TPA: FHA domain-containing protein [Myxococcaceae bacterium]|nr:FHA domain-containing protein [Myxococcaceae bacterium]
MNFEFEHLGTTTPFELAEGQHRLGGGPDDQVRLEGLPPSLLTLSIEGPRLTVEASGTFTVSDVFVPAGVARLVLPGEVLGLPGQMRLKVLQPAQGPERGMGTVAVLKHLLTDGEGLVASRAPTLTCLTGPDAGRTFVLAEAKTELGRGENVDLRIRDRAVSRNHARIIRDGSRFAIRDLGSPNGVFVNGHRVKRSTRLFDGDVLELGQTILRFQGAEEEPSSASVASAEPAPPPLEAATPAPVPARAQRAWWLIGLGAATALLGVLVTYALVS